MIICKSLQTCDRIACYIPSNQHNLLALGRWDKYGGRIEVAHGHLSLLDKDGKTRATGRRLDSNLYQMSIRVRKNDLHRRPPSTSKNTSYVAQATSKSWETWHHRFGHIGYSGLENLLTRGLVDGFDVDTTSPKPDCQACTEAKQSIPSFPKQAEH